jgi:hypothetical protein
MTFGLYPKWQLYVPCLAQFIRDLLISLVVKILPNLAELSPLQGKYLLYVYWAICCYWKWKCEHEGFHLFFDCVLFYVVIAQTMGLCDLPFPERKKLFQKQKKAISNRTLCHFTACNTKQIKKR